MKRTLWPFASTSKCHHHLPCFPVEGHNCCLVRGALQQIKLNCKQTWWGKTVDGPTQLLPFTSFRIACEWQESRRPVNTFSPPHKETTFTYKHFKNVFKNVNRRTPTYCKRQRVPQCRGTYCKWSISITWHFWRWLNKVAISNRSQRIRAPTISWKIRQMQQGLIIKEIYKLKEES